MPWNGSWRKKGPPDAPSRLQHIGRRLLAALSRRRDVDPSVPSHVARIVLDDGSTVEAKWVGNQPVVTVTPAVAEGVQQPPCTIVMESGLLDLGVPVTVSHFDRPTFDDSRPRRYRGSLWDCEDTRVPGARYTVTRPVGFVCDQLDDDDPPESKACDTATRGWMTATIQEKKQAQAVLPASMWTGLMRRYVQALYGNPKAAYRVSSFQPDAVYHLSNDDDIQWWAYLEVPTAGGDEDWFPLTWGWENEGTVGLVYIGATFYFARVERASVKFRPLRFTPCGRAALQASRLLPDGPEQDAMFSAALSTAIPAGADAEIEVAFDAPFEDDPDNWYFLRTPGRYGWSFNHAGDKASLVVCEFRDMVGDLPATPYPKTWLYTLNFGLDLSGDIEVTRTTVEEVNADLTALPNTANPGLYIPTRGNTAFYPFAYSIVSIPNNYSLFPQNWDAPVFCYYERDDTLNVTRVRVENAELLDENDPSECYGVFAVGEFWEGSECETRTFDARYYASLGFYGPGWTNVTLGYWTSNSGSTARCFTEYGERSTQDDDIGPGLDLSDRWHYWGAQPEEECPLCEDAYVGFVQCEEIEDAPEETLWAEPHTEWQIQPYTRRSHSLIDVGSLLPELILPNGSATSPVARSYVFTSARVLTFSERSGEAVVSRTHTLSLGSGWSCAGALTPSVRCGSGGYTLPDPPPSTPTGPSGSRFTANEELDVTIARDGPLTLPQLTGTIDITFGADPEGVTCPCGPAMSPVASVHDSLWPATSSGPTSFLFSNVQWAVRVPVVESLGGAYSALNDWSIWNWAFPASPPYWPPVSPAPWPLTASHDLPASAGGYYSFIGWI